jgi:predicted AlkP superfamily phosphohydrolase/phosphomutase
MSSSVSSPSRALVFGIDGVPWGSIRRWVDDGELPNFGRLMTDGAAGPLESTTPATTPLAWPAIFTGTWPDEHGVYGFKSISGDYRQRMSTGADVRGPKAWDLLSPSLVGNVPMTYPAPDVDGALVTGMMTPSMDDRFTHPSAVGNTLSDRVPDYRIGLDWSDYVGREDALLEDLESLVEARRSLMRMFMEREDWRLFFFVYTAPDRLQHLVWDEDQRLEHYRLLDDVLGEAMDHARRHEAVLFVVSDHGFGPASKIVNVNAVLREAGHLVQRDDVGARSLLSRLGVSKDDLLSTLDRFGIPESTISRYVPERLVEGVATRVPGDHVLFDVDYDRTSAFAFGSGGVYVHDSERFERGLVDPAEFRETKDRLVSTFSEVTDPDTGERMLDVVDGAELYPSLEFAPDLVLEGKNGYEVATGLADGPVEPATDYAAGHRPDGVFLAGGPGIEAGVQPDGATVVDVLPTLLHAVDEPVGESMDGRVLTEVFDPDSSAGRRSVETRAYETVDADSDPLAVERDGTVEERLEGLGYMD